MEGLQEALRNLVKAQPTTRTPPYADKFSLEGGTFHFECVGQGSKLRVSCLLFSPEAYPGTGAFLSCEGSSNERIQEALAALSERRFSTRTELGAVVQQVLAAFTQHGGMDSMDTDMACAQSMTAHSDVMDVDTPHGGDDDKGGASMDGSDQGNNSGSDNQSEQSYGGSGGEEPGDDDDDDDEEEDDPEDRQITIECGKRQGRWERFEAAKELAEVEEEKGMSVEQAAVKKGQIFDKREAFLMLSQELLAIFKEQSYDMFVDTEKDNVYHWAVELSGFAPNSPLAQDMADIQRKYNYSSVKLSLTFMRDLHPFYPASVEVLRPHFKHWAHGAAASHPMLQLSNWDPLRPQKKFIEQLKTFLETSARVDMESELNDITRFPTSSYRPVERHLAQLEALTGRPPLCVMDLEGSSEAARKLYESRGCVEQFPQQGAPSGSGSGDGGSTAAGKKRGRTSGEAVGAGAAGTATGTAAGAGGSGQVGTVATGAAAATPGLGAAAAAMVGAVAGGVAAAAAELAALAGGVGKAKAGKEDKSEFWARGTGYGHGRQTGEVWDNTASAAAQRARDNEVKRVMATLAQSIGQDLGPLPDPSSFTLPSVSPPEPPGPSSSSAPSSSAPSSSTAAAPTTRRGTRSTAAAAAAAAAAAEKAAQAEAAAAPAIAATAAASSSSPVPATTPTQPGTSSAGAQSSVPTMEQIAAVGLDNDDTGPSTPDSQATLREYPPDPAACYAALASSCLVPVLVHELRTTSFSDMCARQPYYITLMRLTLQLCRPQLARLLCLSIPSESGASLASVAAPLNTPASQFIKLTWDTLVSKVGEESKLKAEEDPNKKMVVAAQLKASADALAELKASMRLALLTRRMAEACEAAVRCGGGGGAGAWGSPSAGPCTSSAAAAVIYCATMRPLQVNLVELSTGGTLTHKYAEQATREGVQPSERVIRLGREIAGLSSDLALNESSSVFVRVDEEHMYMWRALITGPDDTPYSGGCFIFDFYFPTSYPQVNLKTTGGGSVRFNPNLYNCGKVCLSLLGTWQGGKGEGWMPNVSTANQVLLSIQSLIFVPEPYFNEPGYERDMHNEKGRTASRDYNNTIKEATIKYAMLDLLKNPLPEFKEVIETHFRLKRMSLLQMLDKWISDASGSPLHASHLKGHKASLEALLAKL